MFKIQFSEIVWQWMWNRVDNIKIEKPSNTIDFFNL